MPLKSDLWVDSSKFDPSKVSEKTAKLNEKLIQIWKDGPRWYEVGAPEYRKLRWEGKTPLPKPIVLEQGINFMIPSRDEERAIPCRMFKPANGESKGIHMHIHGGGWVLQSEHYQDPYLKYMADHYGLTVISVGYRLAPEDPHPAGANDCYDAAEYFIKHGKEKYGGELMFTGGESAGAHLAVLVALHLYKAVPDFKFRGLLLHFGCYDLSGFLPMVTHHDRALVIDRDVMQSYIDVLLPNTSPMERRDPSISPFFADIRGMELPPALFTCGSEDPLLDDTLFMGAKWQAWGNETVVKVYNGAPHGFIGFSLEACEEVKMGLDDSAEFVRDCMVK
ncbi:alpha/beta-hydrolase [Delitschia confertaspora ATCC 74209]|uniref:Alpha/beta-hydrolase n=1 Tax=Delitschia confertaspora ATCC 74209 TaxID=1513339 RepID=A0A9P4MMU9_9PLEO|nr:alpha/beta-hydrolase [Delitschia confertaspora ATCC 74209]